MAAKKKRIAGITARKKRSVSKASKKKAQKKAPTASSKRKRGKKSGTKKTEGRRAESSPAVKVARRPVKVAVRGKAVVRKKRKALGPRPQTLDREIAPPLPPRAALVRKKKKAKRGPLSIAELRAIRSRAAKVGWKKRHESLKVKRKRERDAARAEAIRLLELERDRRGIERMERLLEKQYQAEMRAAKRQQKLAEKRAAEEKRLRREQDRNLAIERRRIQRGERLIERLQEATADIKEAIVEQTKLNQFSLPEGYSLSEGSYIRQRMETANQMGMESYEAQLLAEELEESVSRIWTTWKSPRNELAIA